MSVEKKVALRLPPVRRTARARSVYSSHVVGTSKPYLSKRSLR